MTTNKFVNKSILIVGNLINKLGYAKPVTKGTVYPMANVHKISPTTTLIPVAVNLEPTTNVYNVHKDGTWIEMVNAKKLMTIAKLGTTTQDSACHVTMGISLINVNVLFRETTKLFPIPFVKHGKEVYVLNAPIELFSIAIRFVKKLARIAILGIIQLVFVLPVTKGSP